MHIDLNKDFLNKGLGINDYIHELAYQLVYLKEQLDSSNHVDLPNCPDVSNNKFGADCLADHIKSESNKVQVELITKIFQKATPEYREKVLSTEKERKKYFNERCTVKRIFDRIEHKLD